MIFNLILHDIYYNILIRLHLIPKVGSFHFRKLHDVASFIKIQTV